MHQPQEGNSVTTPFPRAGKGLGLGALIFGGTTEGRLAVDVCEQAGKSSKGGYA